MLLILPALALMFRSGPQPVRTFEGEISHLTRQGFILMQKTETSAQLVRPKRFSLLWALLWFLVFGVGVFVYIAFYLAKSDEGRYVEKTPEGVRVTRQNRRAL
jgi:hypothetical protein